MFPEWYRLCQIVLDQKSRSQSNDLCQLVFPEAFCPRNADMEFFIFMFLWCNHHFCLSSGSLQTEKLLERSVRWAQFNSGEEYLGPIRLSNFEEELMAAVVWMWEHYEDTMFSGIEGSIIISNSNLLLYGIGADKTSDQKVLQYNNNQYLWLTCLVECLRPHLGEGSLE